MTAAEPTRTETLSDAYPKEQERLRERFGPLVEALEHIANEPVPSPSVYVWNAKDALALLDADIEKLRADFLRYAVDHTPLCTSMRRSAPNRCSCGLDAARKRAGGS